MKGEGEEEEKEEEIEGGEGNEIVEKNVRWRRRERGEKEGGKMLGEDGNEGRKEGECSKKIAKGDWKWGIDV